jgi:hypothetical protein
VRHVGPMDWTVPILSGLDYSFLAAGARVLTATDRRHGRDRRCGKR